MANLQTDGAAVQPTVLRINHGNVVIDPWQLDVPYLLAKNASLLINHCQQAPDISAMTKRKK